ncbi:hypothetical protein MMC25_005565 [Agyrium rufum]|nr:hypothetical protein [Agyrium rufum]
MAEAVFRSQAANDLFKGDIDSAGTAAYHTGDPPDPRTMQVLKEMGITDYRHAARKVEKSDFQNFDYILAMDRDNLIDLEDMKKDIGRRANDGDVEKSKRSKVMLFGDFGGNADEEVKDPYYGGGEGFNIAYEQMVRYSQGLLKEIAKEK